MTIDLKKRLQQLLEGLRKELLSWNKVLNWHSKEKIKSLCWLIEIILKKYKVILINLKPIQMMRDICKLSVLKLKPLKIS